MLDILYIEVLVTGGLSMLKRNYGSSAHIGDFPNQGSP